MNKSINYHNIISFNWRVAWYSVAVWLLSFGLSSVVILPWFYVVFPIFVLALTLLYFRKKKREHNLSKNIIGPVFAQGLSIGFFWFFSIFIFDFIQFVGLDFSGAGVYFLDPRNFIKYPIVLLIPTIYAIVIENNATRRVKNDEWITSGAVSLHN